MKTVKSLLLGAAAGFVAITGAQAADLPGRAAPAEYVRICDTYGAGFFFIPGTDTCLRIGGYVRADYYMQSSQGNSVRGGIVGMSTNVLDANYTTRARLALNFDARSNTEFGLLRSFGEFFVQRGPYTGSLATTTNVASGSYLWARATGVVLNRAFIQFAGFTFGYSASFFNFHQGDVTLGGMFGATATASMVLAYTASFGQGFSATISLEDALYRRIGAFDQLIVTAAAPANVAAGTKPLSGLYGLSYGPSRIPDVVANLRVDQGWGSFQVMGALRQLTDFGFASSGAPFVIGGIAFPNGVQTVKAADQFGYAVGAGLRLNLDMIARGDVLWLQAVYASGAMDYVFNAPSSDGSANRGGISGAGNIAGINSLVVNMRDAIVDTTLANPTIRATSGYSITAGFRHFWTPAVRSSIFAGYSDINQPINAVLPDFKYLQVGINTIWSPVRNLDLGLEVVYHNISARCQVPGAGVAPAASAVCYTNGALPSGGSTFGSNNSLGRTSESAWTATLRIQRNF